MCGHKSRILGNIFEEIIGWPRRSCLQVHALFKSLIFLTFAVFFFLNHKRPICSFSLKRNIIKRIFSQEEIMTSLTLQMSPYGFYFFNLKIAMRVCACVCVACVCVCVLLGQGV